MLTHITVVSDARVDLTVICHLQFFKGHPLEAYMDSTLEVSDDQRGFSLAFGSNYLSTRLYQLTPPEVAYKETSTFFFLSSSM